MEHCVELGLVKSLGVSNCQIAQLIDILAFAKVKPVVNQIELHPYLPQLHLVDFMRDKLKVQPTAYAPLGASEWAFKSEELKDASILRDPLVGELALKYQKSAAQVVLNWHVVHRKHIVIPKTSKKERLAENKDVFGF